MRQVIDEAREAFDWIVVDSPPVVLMPDANLLASMADASVLVVKAGATSYDLVNRALLVLGRERVLGVVLNRSHDHMTSGAYGYYGGYYDPPSSASGTDGQVADAPADGAFDGPDHARDDPDRLRGRSLGLCTLRRRCTVHPAERQRRWQDPAGGAGVPGVSLLRRSLRPAARVRPPRALRTYRPGARIGVVHAGGDLLLVSGPDHRTRRLHDCRRSHHHSRRWLARGVRLGQPARAAARAAVVGGDRAVGGGAGEGDFRPTT